VNNVSVASLVRHGYELFQVGETWSYILDVYKIKNLDKQQKPFLPS